MTSKTTSKSAYKKHWPRKNLGELVNFLENIYPEGLSLEILKKDFGKTVGSWSNTFNRDDLKLSRAERIAEHYGYTLKLMFPKRTFLNDYHPPVRIKPVEDAGNLQGMYLWIRDSGMSAAQVAERMKVTVSVINRALSTGDIQISMLNRFTDAFGITVIWEFNKKNN